MIQGKWNHQSYKSYERCFGINLKEIVKDDQSWPQEYFTWVNLYKIENVKVEDIRKFTWL